MSERRAVVLDSSVGVKWVKPEDGSEEALRLLELHRAGELHLVVPDLFVHEVVAVAVQRGGPSLGARAWSNLDLAELTVIGLDGALARAAFEQCERLGCSLCDSLAPAIAEELGATLYSSDARAHARFKDVVLIGA